MSVNPFSSSFPQLYGKYIDEQGEWDVYYEPLKRGYTLRNGDESKFVEREVIDRHRRVGYNPAINYLAAAERQRRTLSQRWRSRMLRLKEKEQERRMRVLSRAGWGIGLVWGSLLVTVITIYLLKWTTVLVLG